LQSGTLERGCTFSPLGLASRAGDASGLSRAWQ